MSCTGATAEEARVTELPPLAVLKLHVAANLAEPVEVQLPDEAGEVVVLEHRRDQLLCKFLRVLGGGGKRHKRVCELKVSHVSNQAEAKG